MNVVLFTGKTEWMQGYENYCFFKRVRLIVLVLCYRALKSSQPNIEVKKKCYYLF